MLYIRREKDIGKSHEIYALKMRFVLLNKRNELVFLAPTRCAAKSIGESIIYTALSINTHKAKSLSINISKLYTHCLLFIIDELSIIHFGLLVSIEKQLCRVKDVIASSTALFGDLFLVVFIGNFF